MIEDAAKQVMLGSNGFNVQNLEVASGLSRLVDSLQKENTEADKLKLLGAMTAYECTGTQTLENRPELKPSFSEKETLKMCSTAACKILERIISLDNDPLLVEWITYVAATDCIVPHRFLVGLLDKARTNKLPSTILDQVIGNRGKWLAGQNPSWTNINLKKPDELDSSIWEEGDLNERTEYLKILHKLHPNKAREILRRDLASENAGTRARFIETLTTALTDSDEEFLESILNDRSLVVRRAAADLLFRLSGSAFCRRMQERFISSVHIRKKLLGRKSMDIIPLEMLTEDMARDGISEKNGSGMGKKGWLLFEVCKRTSPSWISKIYPIDPESWISLAIKSDWSVPLLSGVLQATVIERNQDWVWAFLNKKLPKEVHFEPLELLDCLDPSAKSQWLQARIDTSEFLQAYHRILSKEFGSKYLDKHVSDTLIIGVQKYLQSKSKNDWSLRNSLPKLATCVSPESLSLAEADWPSDSKCWDYYQDQAEEFFQIIRIRKQMKEEFNHE